MKAKHLWLPLIAGAQPPPGTGPGGVRSGTWPGMWRRGKPGRGIAVFPGIKTTTLFQQPFPTPSPRPPPPPMAANRRRLGHRPGCRCGRWRTAWLVTAQRGAAGGIRDAWAIPQMWWVCGNEVWWYDGAGTIACTPIHGETVISTPALVLGPALAYHEDGSIAAAPIHGQTTVCTPALVVGPTSYSRIGV